MEKEKFFIFYVYNIFNIKADFDYILFLKIFVKRKNIRLN